MMTFRFKKRSFKHLTLWTLMMSWLLIECVSTGLSDSNALLEKKSSSEVSVAVCSR